MKLKIMIMALLLLAGIGSAVNWLPATGFVGDVDMDGNDLNNVGTMYGNWSKCVIIDVSDYGAMGDGTDQTAAINAAIAVANVPRNDSNFHRKYNILYFPMGEYMVQPGALTLINCSIYAPDATFRPSTSSSEEVIPIGTLERGFINIGEVMAYGVDNHMEIVDNEAYTPIGTGIAIYGISRHFAYCDVNIEKIVGFDIGLFLNGAAYDIHIASNTIKIDFLVGNTHGVVLNAQSYQNENNVITIQYAVSNNITVYAEALYSAGTGNNLVQDNIITIRMLELHRRHPGIGIHLNGDMITGNIVDINAMVETTGSIPVKLSNFPDGNIVYLPVHDISTNLLNGHNTIRMIYGVHSTKYGIYSALPSEIYSSSAPSSGTWKVGDRCWNTNPSVGGPPGWICTNDGSPGTWARMANLAT